MKKTNNEKLYDYLSYIDVKEEIKDFSLLKKSMSENIDKTFKVLLFIRDPEYGLGKRSIFRQCIKWIAKTKNKEWKEKLFQSFDDIIYKGRWDDLFILHGTSMEKKVFEYIKKSLNRSYGLESLYKWLPREKSSNKLFAIKLAKYLELSRKEYRKLLSSNTEVVENLICKDRWEDIDYRLVPSEALHKYRWAFMRMDRDRFLSFMLQNKNHKRFSSDYNYKNLVSNGKYS